MSDATVTVIVDAEGPTINPMTQGHFVEHIGGVVYDGIWVGEDSPVPNIHGIRREIVDKLKLISPPVIRYPGGCFADRYHWEDGIGPREARPRRFGRWQEVTEPNHFGTHEFLEFCRLVGAEPYLAANVGSGSPEEFQSWVEYCNAPVGTVSQAVRRAENGHPEPFRVKYWGVGNEPWGCGGHFRPETYCDAYRQFATWVPGYGVDPVLIAAGPSGDDPKWTRRFFERHRDYMTAPLHGWAPHYYCGTTGHALEFSGDQWYEMLAKAQKMEPLIEAQWAALHEFDRERQIQLYIDEWGTWHPGGTELHADHLFGQQNCLRDALVAALTLDIFNRHADKVAMGCIAQLVNCLQALFMTTEDKFVCTPNYHVFALYASHQGATSLPCLTQVDDVNYIVGESEQSLWGLAGSASRKGETVTLTLVNPLLDTELETRIRLVGGNAASVAQRTLTHTDPAAYNTFDDPDQVRPTDAALEQSGGELTLRLASKSITRLTIELG